MICPKCKFEQPDGNRECMKCGLIFARYTGPAGGGTGKKAAPPSGAPVREPEFSFFDWLRDLLFHVDPDVNVFYFAGRVLLYVVVLIYCIKYFLTPMVKCYQVMPFMHLVNLPFHEAGHIIFMPFGRFIMFLGGTLGQLLMPLVCLFALLIPARNNFGASASLW